MDDAERAANRRAPLAAFDGAVPPAPGWFTRALAIKPEEHCVTVAGASLEMLIWGDAGKPGLLFLHGNGAHAGWWRFIAPFFAADYRIAAFSWSGMGGSDHRDAYSIEGFVAEIFAVAEAAGLEPKPVIVAHSFGGFPAMVAAHLNGDRLGGVVVVDTPFREPGEQFHGRPPNATNRPHKVYATLPEALARFRFAPEQSCKNLYIADLIARGSLIEVPGGWSWAFDPYLWHRFNPDENPRLLAEPDCPVALIWGERSLLMPPQRIDSMRARLPAGTPAIPIPDAAHHVMIDQPLAFVAALRGLFTRWPS